jgi:transcriptional regulator with XRE-family HTH domain
MGRGKRYQPKRLAEKLIEIRNRLDLNQSQMFKRLGETPSKIYASHISSYEQGTREPPLDVLLQYARIAGVPMEILINDELDLPEILLSQKVYEWVLTMRERKS